MKIIKRLFVSLLVVVMLVSFTGVGTVIAYSSEVGVDSRISEPIISVNNASVSQINSFVERLYTYCLGRGSDPTGIAHWSNLLSSGQYDGANTARGFFFSQEFIDRNLNLEEYLTTLYRVFFNRGPDYLGMCNWINQAFNGYSYQEILECFINSTEWANTCLQYGIISGGSATPNNAIYTVDSGISSFVNRLYSGVLSREADPDGYSYWCNRLATMVDTGSEAAYGFIFSTEFQNRFASMTNEERVNTFYNVFLGRGADPEGFAHWNTLLQSGGTLTDLFNGFVDSQEFASICANAGIMVRRTYVTPIQSPVQTYVIRVNNDQYAIVSGYFDVAGENNVFSQTNALRQSLGLSPLVMTEQMQRIARYRAAELAYSYQSNHDRPNGEPWSTLYPIGYSGENIMCGYVSDGSLFPSSVIYLLWHNSPEHYNNMVDSRFQNIGVGVFVFLNESYAVQSFQG